MTNTVDPMTWGPAFMPWERGSVLTLSRADRIHAVAAALDAEPDIDSVSWRLSLGALQMRTEVLRVLGGLDPAVRGCTGAGLEPGHRMIDRGAVVEHTPRLAPRMLIVEPLSEHDRFVFLCRMFGRLWILHAALRGRSPAADR